MRTAGYPSRAQAERNTELRELAAAGDISDLREEVDLFDTADGETFRIDFTYRLRDDVLVYEDVKAGLWSAAFWRKWNEAKRRFLRVLFRIAVPRRGGGFRLYDTAPREAA